MDSFGDGGNGIPSDPGFRDEPNNVLIGTLMKS